MKSIPLLLLVLPLLAVAQAEAPQQPAAGPCDATEYRQFDFWIGSWNVSSDDQPAGTNTIRRIHGGCVLEENWQGTGAGGISGSSFNIYDRAVARWHQTWVDASGTLLQLEGGLIDGSMVLSGSRPVESGATALHRISWTPNEDGSVRQLWETSLDGGASWSVLFDGLYVKADVQP